MNKFSTGFKDEMVKEGFNVLNLIPFKRNLDNRIANVNQTSLRPMKNVRVFNPVWADNKSILGGFSKEGADIEKVAFLSSLTRGAGHVKSILQSGARAAESAAAKMHSMQQLADDAAKNQGFFKRLLGWGNKAQKDLNKHIASGGSPLEARFKGYKEAWKDLNDAQRSDIKTLGAVGAGGLIGGTMLMS